MCNKRKTAAEMLLFLYSIYLGYMVKYEEITGLRRGFFELFYKECFINGRA